MFYGKLKVYTVLGLLLCACSTTPSGISSPLETIDKVRALAGYPQSDVVFVETTTMINSPNGDLKVDLYEDEDGRKFFIEPGTSTLVEIDARNLLEGNHSETASTGAALSQPELAERAEQFVRSAVPEFTAAQSDLIYEAGAKGDMFFFTWRSDVKNVFMPPFIQVGITSNGDLFAFYNTIGFANK